MPALIRPQPAIDALKESGWTYVSPLGNVRHAGVLMKSPDGIPHRLQFYGRKDSKNKSGQYLFGLYYRDFDVVDDVVLWATRQPALLVLPSKFLKGVFDLKRAKIDAVSDRWHINVYFERFGNAELVPVHYGACYTVNNYAVPCGVK